MSAFDKFEAMEALKAHGWTEAPESGEWALRPPKALLDKLATMTFHVYEARDLQAFLPERDQVDDGGS